MALREPQVHLFYDLMPHFFNCIRRTTIPSITCNWKQQCQLISSKQFPANSTRNKDMISSIIWRNAIKNAVRYTFYCWTAVQILLRSILMASKTIWIAWDDNETRLIYSAIILYDNRQHRLEHTFNVEGRLWTSSHISSMTTIMTRHHKGGHWNVKRSISVNK